MLVATARVVHVGAAAISNRGPHSEAGPSDPYVGIIEKA